MMATSDCYNFVNLMNCLLSVILQFVQHFFFCNLRSSRLICLAQNERNCIHRVGFHQLSAEPYYAERMIGLNNSRQVFIQSRRSNTNTNCDSFAYRGFPSLCVNSMWQPPVLIGSTPCNNLQFWLVQLHVTTSSFDWFTVLSVSFLIG